MTAIPAVATHRYDPAIGPCLNLCSLPYRQATLVVDRLRSCLRPRLKPDYLDLRLATEAWLAAAASEALHRHCTQRPAYFFLGDFSWAVDLSRPAALVIRLANLPADAVTFTLGDSMSVAEQQERRVYALKEMVPLFGERTAMAGFGFSDRAGIQARFIELQVWDCSSITKLAWLIAERAAYMASETPPA